MESSRANDFTIESVNELPRKLKREDASHTIKFKNGKIEKVMVEPPSKGLEVTVDGAASSVKVIITAAKLPEKDAEFQIVIVGKGDSGKEKTFRLRLKMPEPGDDQSSVSFSAPFENDIEVLLDDPMIVKVTTVKPYKPSRSSREFSEMPGRRNTGTRPISSAAPNVATRIESTGQECISWMSAPCSS